MKKYPLLPEYHQTKRGNQQHDTEVSPEQAQHSACPTVMFSGNFFPYFLIRYEQWSIQFDFQNDDWAFLQTSPSVVQGGRPTNQSPKQMQLLSTTGHFWICSAVNLQLPRHTTFSKMTQEPICLISLILNLCIWLINI